MYSIRSDYETPTSFDRSVQPPLGPDPEVTLPAVWTSSLSNGMKLYGIRQTELPLIQYSITISGGHMLDAIDKAGVASLTASLMNEGTKNKTPEELEDAVKLLGASIVITSYSIHYTKLYDLNLSLRFDV